MEAPSALDVDYIQRRNAQLQEQTQPEMLTADFELNKPHHRELNKHLRDVAEGKAIGDIEKEQAQHEVGYTFGDAGSQWRMTKLKAVYREAEETKQPIEDIAIERFGDLRSFDDAREEENELDRRERYGGAYVGKEKPSGEFFQQRKLDHGIRKDEVGKDVVREFKPEDQSKQIEPEPTARITQHPDATALNRLRAQIMKAKLKGSSDIKELEERYNASAALLANRDVIVLGIMDNRMLAGGQRREVKPIENKRGRERGLVEENEDMTIEDMVRDERRTRGQPGGEGQLFAERISRDTKFTVSTIRCLLSLPFLFSLFFFFFFFSKF